MHINQLLNSQVNTEKILLTFKRSNLVTLSQQTASCGRGITNLGYNRAQASA